MVVEAEGGSALLWLEKEQLFEVAIAIKRMLAQAPQLSRQPTAPRPSIHNASLEFTIGSFSLSHDSRRNLLRLQANELGDQEPLTTVTFWTGTEVLAELSEEALKTVAAGRPRCPLCTAPMGPEGHVCSRANGHFDIKSELEPR